MTGQKLYGVSETGLTWASSGGDELLTLTSLGAAAGRQGALHDFNLGTAKAIVMKWRFWCQFATNPVVGEIVQVRWKRGDGTHYDNDDGTGDIAVSSINKLNNVDLLKSLIVDEALQDIEMSTGGILVITEEFGGPVIWNATADAFTTTALEHKFTLTPIVNELQASA